MAAEGPQLPTSLPDTDGASVPLWGGGATLLVLVPFAFSAVCTDEVHAWRTAFPRVRAGGSRLLVVSCDPVPALRAWREAERLPFPVLSDFWPHGALASALQAFDAHQGTARRVSVLLDVAGQERWRVQSPPGRPRDVEEQVRALDLVAAGP